MLPIGASEGFALGDAYALGVLFLGFVVLVAVVALSRQGERAFSASLIYLALGGLAAIGFQVVDVDHLDPVGDAEVLERITEFAVVVALFGTGLRLDRPLSWRGWASTARLLVLVMPLTIAAVTAWGVGVMELSLGAALALGAILAPTDPVLAGDVGVGPIDEEDESEPRFAITSEAGLNDGLAFPFIFLAVFIAAEGGSDWTLEWVAADVLYGVGLGVLLGGVAGGLIAQFAHALRGRGMIERELDGWVAIAAVLVVYGTVESIGAYGFLAVFTAGLTFRRYEHGNEFNHRVHAGAEVVEKAGELAVVLLLGSLMTETGVSAPGVAGWLLVPVLLLLIRPLATELSFLGSRLGRNDRFWIGWFGVRGIGSLYYAAIIAGTGVLSTHETDVVVWTACVCAAVSILVHGLTATPLARRWT